MVIIKKIIIKLPIFAINISLALISLFIPKSKRIVVIGGWFGHRFADNSKYLFLYLNEFKKELNINKIVWITRSEKIYSFLKSSNYTVYKVFSIQSFYYHFRARYHFIDQSPKDILGFLSVRSIKINLWHGFPLKKIGFYCLSNRLNNKNKLNSFIRSLFSPGYWSNSYILATSTYAKHILGKAFNKTLDSVIVSQYPRVYNIIHSRKIDLLQPVEEDMQKKLIEFKESGYTILGYFPTFRDTRPVALLGTNDVNALDEFFKFCEKNKYIFITKFHFASRGLIEKNNKFDFPNFHNLSKEVDIYSILDRIDILITDYSSVYFDFLLYKRPIIFFPYDLQYYIEKDRGLIFNYEEMTPGYRVDDIDELKMLLLTEPKEIESRYLKSYKNQVHNLKNKVFDENNDKDVFHLMEILRTF